MIEMFPGLVGTPPGLYTRVQEAEDRARGAESRGRELSLELEQLGERLDSLVLVTASIWSLVKERTDLDDEGLRERFQEMDLRDGRLDGRLTPHVGICPACQRKTNGRRRACLYCGGQLPPTSPVA